MALFNRSPIVPLNRLNTIRELQLAEELNCIIFITTNCYITGIGDLLLTYRQLYDEIKRTNSRTTLEGICGGRYNVILAYNVINSFFRRNNLSTEAIYTIQDVIDNTLVTSDKTITNVHRQ